MGVQRTPVAEKLATGHTIEDRGHATECWVWGGWTAKNGYGLIETASTPKRVVRLAHRLAYELAHGEIPDGLDLDHLCRVRACVNPAHLQPVTRRTNVLRGEGHAAVNARKESCHRGHPFDEANTRRHGPDGRYRECRACHRERAAASRRKARG